MLDVYNAPTMAENFLHDAQHTKTASKAKSYSDLERVKQVSNSKYPIFQLTSTTTQENYAAKVFKTEAEDSEKHYRNEIRFATLKHPNVVSIVHHVKDKEVVTPEGETKLVTGILMEYAPHGDLFDFIVTYCAHDDEKLIRTFFKQVIEGLEYLHANGVAHLDLKPENVIISEDFTLKICDFDLSYKVGDTEILSRGTECYRAPELYLKSTSKKPELPSFPADIYGAGIILFLLKNGGIYPHNENEKVRGIDFFNLMHNKNSEFWKKHCEVNGMRPTFYDSNFKDLFTGMTKFKPKDRMTIKQIKKSKWYNGAVYTPAEYKERMNKIIHG